jgi:hypothetical protein
VEPLQAKRGSNELHLLNEVLDRVARGVGEHVRSAAADQVEEDDFTFVCNLLEG